MTLSMNIWDVPSPADLPLLQLAETLELSHAELLSIALVLAVESEVMAGRAVAQVQAPLGGSRPHPRTSRCRARLPATFPVPAPWMRFSPEPRSAAD